MKNITSPYLYKWIQKSTGKWYIGSKTQENWNPSMHEKYICSSKIVKPLILENRTDWTYNIIATGEKHYIRKLETDILVLLDAKNNPMSYNQSNARIDPGNRLGYLPQCINNAKRRAKCGIIKVRNLSETLQN